MIRPPPRTVLLVKAVLAVFAMVLGVLAPAPALADDADAAALLTFEGQAALRERLSERLLLMSAAPIAGDHEDPSWVVWQHGEAVRTLWGGKIRVLTSQVLAESAGRLEASRIGGGGVVGPARVAEIVADVGLAVLECPACAKEKAAPTAPTEACEPGRFLFFVVPAGDNAVITHTVMGAPAEPPLEKLRIVPGALPEGTPLFDSSARVAAIAIRALAGFNQTLVAPLCPAPPPPTPTPPADRTPPPDTRQAP